MFVLGLAERMFPRKIVEEPILLDGVREQISIRLQTNQSRLGDERLAMALAVAAAERKVCFSYPRALNLSNLARAFHPSMRSKRYDVIRRAILTP